MNHKITRISGFICLILIYLLAACTLPGAGNGNAQDNSANKTAVAQTVQANETANAQAATNAAATQAPAATDPPAQDLLDDATFIGDITIPDQSYIEKGAPFSKTWRVQNSGESTWTTDYRLVYERDDKMGAADFIMMPKEVKPGETVDLTVEFTAPETPGEYRSTWMLQNAKGGKFGVGSTGDMPVFVWIFSVEPNQGNQGGISGGASIASVTLAIDQAVYSGACPVNLNLSWTITTNDAGQVNHTLNLVPNTQGFTFTPVQTFSANFGGAGSQSYQYLLIISDSVDATARANATGSSTVLSNLVGFSVNCQ